MNNQLELNEAEMAYYEDVVNQLADRLECAKEDYDKLMVEKEEAVASSLKLEQM